MFSGTPACLVGRQVQFYRLLAFLVRQRPQQGMTLLDLKVWGDWHPRPGVPVPPSNGVSSQLSGFPSTWWASAVCVVRSSARARYACVFRRRELP